MNASKMPRVSYYKSSHFHSISVREEYTGILNRFCDYLKIVQRNSTTLTFDIHVLLTNKDMESNGWLFP